MNADDNKILSQHEVAFFGYNFDEIGKVFHWNGHILRGIYPNKEREVKELMTCGLIDELIKNKLFPKTTISAYIMEGFALILEHEKISPVIYPSDWSFDMIKDAALCVLEVNKIARKYGYQTIDSHGYNVLFKAGTPYFIDLGSFIKSNENPNGWLAYEEFIRYYYYPLKVFKSGNLYFGRAAMTQGKNFMTHSSYYQFRFPLLRFIRPHKIERLFEIYHKYKVFSHFTLEEINQRAPNKLKGFLSYLKKKKNAPFQSVNLHRLERKIKRINLSADNSQWGDYHDSFFDGENKIKLTPRFTRILEIIKELNPESIVEVGGNQGMLSELILQQTNVSSITCTDYDEIAVNKMYHRIKAKNLNITPSILDIVSPVTINYGPSLSERYKSKMLIALALTHHLVLTQKIPLNQIFEQFNEFSSKYIMTEFMPLGLYSATAKRNHEPPNWYNEEWFKNEFERHYTLLYKEKLENNRILFVGERKPIH